LIGGKLEHAQKLADEQSPTGFWNGGDRFFNTAISYFATKSLAVADLDAAKTWVLGNQNGDFSWGVSEKHRNTAAILYAIFGRASSSGGSVQRCENFGEPLKNVCCSTSQLKIGYEEITSLSCANKIGTKCVIPEECEIPETEETCGDRGLCCRTAAVGAEKFTELDDTCFSGDVCAASCEQEQPQSCSRVGGVCCSEAGEDSVRYSGSDEGCSSGQVCASECKPIKGAGGFLTFLIWFLGILVVIGGVILAFILIKKRKGKSKVTKLPGLSGLGPPRPPPVIRRPMPARMPQRPQRRFLAARRPGVKKKEGKTEDELEKTLRELEKI